MSGDEFSRLRAAAAELSAAAEPDGKGAIRVPLMALVKLDGALACRQCGALHDDCAHRPAQPYLREEGNPE